MTKGESVRLGEHERLSVESSLGVPVPATGDVLCVKNLSHKKRCTKICNRPPTIELKVERKRNAGSSR